MNTSTQTKNDQIKQGLQAHVPPSKDEICYDANNPIIKAFKEHHEYIVEPSEPPTKKVEYGNDNK